ncbi:amidohydrolase family protein [Gilvimarinus sp. 1_MG-2023]|uniref:amidohydrolase family protein n=1 Tax=Gilvimarinus sp. 1_MG-2023 TaxID=3062638 RepID=UPI0026E36825|nr:amidohydrolase family protein [Gilvimarinus sp. 1_MG-2023]MDO6748594.1 amidohydrolase family protein [Gilvimarinus sp. 1_MG-2023]
MLRIDAHQHVWQLNRGDYHWLTPELTPLYRDFLARDLQPLLERAGVSKTVLVQAAASVEETEYMLDLAETTDFIAGVVGWVDMEQKGSVETLERLASHSALKGIRPMIQDIVDPRWMLKPELDAIFSVLIERGLSFDALITPSHLDALEVLLGRYPQLKVVIDHAAKPNIACGMDEPWRKKISRIAANSHAYCKLSGLITEAGEHGSFDDLTPYLSHLLSSFGADRLMWGSDWPVLTLAASYDDWVGASEAFIGRLDDAQQAAIWGKTAQAFYNL